MAEEPAIITSIVCACAAGTMLTIEVNNRARKIDFIRDIVFIPLSMVFRNDFVHTWGVAPHAG
jgi:hypothetical protein